MSTRLSIAVVMMGLFFAGLACDSSDPTPKTDASGNDGLPQNLFIAVTPTDAKNVAEVRKSAKDGDSVVVRGVIGGRVDPMAENRAVFTLLDSGIKTCNQIPGDTCPTPWDACCETTEVLTANSITVQVVNGEGKPVKKGLKGVNNLEPLKQVVIAGKFKSSDDKIITVNATSIYVEK